MAQRQLAVRIRATTQGIGGGEPQPHLHGVVIKELHGDGDDRQIFREIIRSTDEFFTEGFGQLSYALMYPIAFRSIASAPMPFFVKPVARGIVAKVRSGYLDPNLERNLAFMESSLAGSGSVFR